MGFESSGSATPADQPESELEARREEALAKGQILPEDAEAGRETFIAEARKKVDDLNAALSSYREELEEVKKVETNENGMFEDKGGSVYNKEDSIKRWNEVIDQTEAELERTEKKIMSKL